MSDSQRLLILVPSATDYEPALRKYFDNVVWRVRDLLERDGLDLKLVVVNPGERTDDFPTDRRTRVQP